MGYPEIRNFWDNFNKAYYEWARKELTYNALWCCSPQDLEFEWFLHTELIQTYCSKHFHAQNCTQCDDLCEIQNIDPCRTIWTDLSEECCRTCDLFFAHCEVEECAQNPQSYNATSSIYGNIEDFRDSNLFYVLVILLPICCFIGRGIK